MKINKKIIVALITVLVSTSVFYWFHLPVARATDTLDQSNATGSTGIGFGDTLNGRDYMCQGFKPTLTPIDAVSFYVNSKDGSATIGYKVWIDNADANSNPTGSVGVGIGGATLIPNVSLNTSTTTKYGLASTVAVTAGNQYAICFAPWDTTATNAWASSYHDWVTSTANPYANGRRVHLDGSFATPTAPDSGNDDILFEVYSQGSPAIAYTSSSVLTSGTDVDGNSTATSASVTPTTNKLELLEITSRTGITADPNQPTVTGDSLTWVAINTVVYDNTSSSRRRITLFRALGTPASGTLAIDFASQNQTDVSWILTEIGNTDTSGTNGSGAVVQSAVNSDPSGTGTSVTATLAAFGSANNATFGALGCGGVTSDTTGSGAGFAKLKGIKDCNNDEASMVQLKSDNDTTVDGYCGVADEIGMVAIEIKPAAVAVATVQATAESFNNGATNFDNGATNFGN